MILATILISILIIVVLSIFNNKELKIKTKSNKLVIITTLFPLYDIAKNIGGDKVDVVLLL